MEKNQNSDDKPSMAGGFFIAICMLAGFIIGIFQGQPSAGTVIGLAIGCIIALFIWWRDRRNNQGS